MGFGDFAGTVLLPPRLCPLTGKPPANPDNWRWKWKTRVPGREQWLTKPCTFGDEPVALLTQCERIQNKIAAETQWRPDLRSGRNPEKQARATQSGRNEIADQPETPRRE